MSIGKVDRIVTFAIGLFGLAYLVLMSPYPFEAKLVPMIVDGVLLLMVAFQWAGPLIPRLRPVTAGKEEDEAMPFWPDAKSRANFARIGLWSILLYVLIVLIGFVLASGLAMFLFLLFYDRVSWKVNVGLTLLVAAFAYMLVGMFLELPWLDGILINLII